MKRSVCKKTGYSKISLRVGGKPSTHRVHRLILEAFDRPGQEGELGCHFPDPDKRNCRIANLRWDTHEGNIQDNVRLGRIRKGQDIESAKVNPTLVIEIRRKLDSGHPIRRLAREHGVDPQTIRRIKTRQTWSHVS